MGHRKFSRLNALFSCVVAVLVLMPLRASAQYHPKDTEWPSYAADLAGTRYRPLDQINASNFNDLEIAWRIKTDNFEVVEVGGVDLVERPVARAREIGGV